MTSLVSSIPLSTFRAQFSSSTPFSHSLTHVCTRTRIPIHPFYIRSSLSSDHVKEQALHDWLHGNFSANCQALAKEVADESKPFPGRQLASLYLKNAFHAKAVALVKEKHARWKVLDAAARQPVKESLLAAMRSPCPGVPHFTAICAAEIAAVELPYNEWPQFVPALMENVTSQQSDEPVKLASLECLGYAAERIAEVEEMMDIPPLAVATVDSMLTTIVDGVQPVRSDKMRFAALQALKNSLAFVKKNMQVKSERDFVMRAICEASQSQAAQVRELAYSCFDSIADLYYDNLPDYMTVIFELTTASIQKDPEEKVQMAAIEFWSTLAFTEQILLDEELACREDGTPLDRPACPQYVKAAMDSLVPILLSTLSKQDEEADDDELDLQSHGASCIEIISQTVEALIVPVVIPFVQSNITHADWRLRDAGIVAFTCILDGPSTSVVGQYVSESIPVLMNAFNDGFAAVRDSATHCVSKICQLHIQAIPGDQFHMVIQGLISKLQEYPRVAAHACSAIFNIAQSLKQQNAASNEEETNMLSAPMLALMQALLAASDREDAIDSNLRVSSVSAAAELIGASARDVQHIFRDLLPVIVSRIEAGLQLQVVSNEDQENKEQLLGLLSGLMTALFQTMNKADIMAHADRIMNLLLQIFQMRTATCHEEAFLAVGAFASAMEEEFTVRNM
jgi:importin subunit beta-1